MERLTKWNEQTEQAELLSWDEEEWKDFMGSLDVPIATELSFAINKLAEYEDAEEQGLLIGLPCKVGDTLFYLIQEYDVEENTTMYKIKELEVIGYGGNKLNPVVITAQDNRRMIAHKFSKSAFGRRVFLAIEEAEAALAEMEK